MNATGKATCAAVLALASVAAAGQTPSLKTLYEQHRWFELREALKHNKGPALYIGAVASASNDIKRAEKYLHQAIELAPTSDEAAEAHEMLGYIYARSSRNREALQQLNSILKIRPGRADVENVRAIYAAFSQHPNQSVRRSRPTTLQADISKDSVVLPITVKGKTVHWFLDTDFNLSAMSESEAQLLGITVDSSSAQAGDLAGGTTRVRVRIAVVDELAIGDVHLRNVSFLIVPDSQSPMDGLPAGSRGLIGFPVAFALQSIGWKSDGTFEIGFAAGRPRNSDANLFLDGLAAVTRVQWAGKELDFILDTGNQTGTELWERFAVDFAPLLKQSGTRGRRTLTEVTGSHEWETTVLPELRLRVGGLDTSLRSVAVFRKPVGDDFHHGLLGMDVLSQAREVRIDFQSMTLRLVP